MLVSNWRELPMRFCHFSIIPLVLVSSCVPAGAGLSAFLQSESGCTLRIHVDGLRNSTGVVGSAIFKSPAGWPEDMDKTVHHWPTPIAPGAHEATAVMQNLPPGDYGVV